MSFAGHVLQSIHSLRNNKQLLAKRKPLHERKRYQGINKVRSRSPQNIPSNIKTVLKNTGWNFTTLKSKRQMGILLLSLLISCGLVFVIIAIFFTAISSK